MKMVSTMSRFSLGFGVTLSPVVFFWLLIVLFKSLMFANARIFAFQHCLVENGLHIHDDDDVEFSDEESIPDELQVTDYDHLIVPIIHSMVQVACVRF
jgi:hypothetical protein